jgi:hypothetical protein
MLLDFPPICQVEGCKEPCQIVSKKGDLRTYMKTCRRHNYNDLLKEQEHIETMWPPTNS